MHKIKIIHRLSCPVVPFATIEIKVSNYKLNYRNLLPPRYKMKAEQLDAYDSWNKKSKYFKMNKEDFDSIVMCIENLKILEIDKKYSDPKSVNGLTSVKLGNCNESYIFLLDHSKIEFPIKNSNDFELPTSILKFDLLFKRIAQRYIITK